MPLWTMELTRKNGIYIYESKLNVKNCAMFLRKHLAKAFVIIKVTTPESLVSATLLFIAIYQIHFIFF